MIFNTDDQGAVANGSQAAPHQQNQLMAGKTVLVMGNETAVLQNLMMRLAEKGANVVLLCWQLSPTLRQKLEQFAYATEQRLLVIEHTANRAHSTEQLVQDVISKWGKFDFFIDLSVRKDKRAQIETHNDDAAADWMRAQWRVTRAVLQDPTLA